MAEDIIRIKLESNLKEMVDANKRINSILTTDQKESIKQSVDKTKIGLSTQDFKLFDQNFNKLFNIFRDAMTSSGLLSKSLEELTDRQIALNKEINELKSKKVDLTTKLKNKSLTQEEADDFAKKSDTAKKVQLTTGKVATHNDIIALQKALKDYLEQQGKSLRQLTKTDIQNIKTADNLQFKDIKSAQASNRYVGEIDNYSKSLQSQ